MPRIDTKIYWWELVFVIAGLIRNMAFIPKISQIPKITVQTIF